MPNGSSRDEIIPRPARGSWFPISFEDDVPAAREDSLDLQLGVQNAAACIQLEGEPGLDPALRAGNLERVIGDERVLPVQSELRSDGICGHDLNRHVESAAAVAGGYHGR